MVNWLNDQSPLTNRIRKGLRMKIRTMVLSCLIGAAVLSMSFEYSSAGPKVDEPASKIGVVSIQKIFGESKRSARYDKEIAASQSIVMAELNRLAKEIEADKAGLKTLKVGSSDHLAKIKGILEKESKYDAQQNYHQQEKAFKYQQYIEQLYTDILRQTNEVAKEKGLTMVVEKDEVEFPALSVDGAMLAIRTHKLLYSGGCLDITEDVMAGLDAQEDEKK